MIPNTECYQLLSRKGYNYENFVPGGVKQHGCHGWTEDGSYQFNGIKRFTKLKFFIIALNFFSFIEFHKTYNPIQTYPIFNIIHISEKNNLSEKKILKPTKNFQIF